jgi:hypothetical protein
MSDKYDKLITDMEKTIAHADSFVGLYAALEKDFILEKLKVDVQDQTHLQKIILSIIKAIKHMEKQLP